MVLRELIIYDTNSSNYEEYKKEFLELYESSDASLTSIERWSLSTIAQLLKGETKGAKIPEAPSNLLNFNFSHHYFTLVNTNKQIQYILSNHGATWGDSGVKLLKSISAQLNRLIKSFREDSLELNTVSKNILSEYNVKVGDWFAKDPIGSAFQITAKQVNASFESIKDANYKSIVELRKI
ncbi:unnamed protein product [Ambrosiozyma monospora]|uniref:Unnamed protein product n=1 Tax=Ambrosiozyma monospora TaxID=43982 RepID=A0ACB5TWS1_AMBMO|nr:unnamed protein product [Ambrosiozyma monospora]